MPASRILEKLLPVVKPTDMRNEIKQKRSLVTWILSKNNKLKLCDKTLYPIYYLLLLLGINHSLLPKYTIPFRMYSWIVFGALCFTTARKFSQIGMCPDGSRLPLDSVIVDPRSLLTLCNALVMASGLLAASLLFTLGGKNLLPLKILCENLKGTRSKASEQRHLAFNSFLAGISAFLAFLMAFVYAMSKYGIISLAATPNFKSETVFCVLIDAYAIFVSRCAITTLAILFCYHCNILRKNIKKLILEMVPEDQDECPLPEMSLKKIHDAQVEYQKIFNGKTVIEDYFSFALFYSYGCCIPIFCLLMYVLLKSHQISWPETLSISIWIVNAIIVLLLFSIPAFMIHEEGDKLLSASFRMYHETFYEERDLLVLAQMTFFAIQIHSTKLTLSACNYFYMNRRILLSLFSAIITYFLILMEFDMKTPSIYASQNYTTQIGEPTESRQIVALLRITANCEENRMFLTAFTPDLIL
ncbi:unnamed protein product [Caenorhabditis auriculariae]|uniref:Uncharacterized protein n=1 Tax=Caenorhabditis auriculariae TaxID=2777116 RepID=A0A8S1H212_9PELO|nr:unnamed protein product [Caenorhabditis auriculariae]